MSTAVPKRAKKRQAAAAVSTWDAIARRDADVGLTRERIVDAGIAIADEQGLAAVSIRKVATKLNASAMALYHYVPSKRDLLNLMLDATYADCKVADGAESWRESLHHFAWESRRLLQRHPWISLLRVSEPEYGPQCIRILEALLTNLARFGLDIRTAIRLMGALFVFVNGFVAAEGSAPGSGQQPVFSRTVLATGQFPKVARFVEMGAELPDDKAFERALNWMLMGIAADMREPGTGPGAARRGVRAL